MRRLSLFDIIVTFAVLGLLLYLSSREFPRYRDRTIPAERGPVQEAR